MKEKCMDIAISSLNFESFSENFTLYSKHQCYKNFYFKRYYVSENESRDASTKEVF